MREQKGLEIGTQTHRPGYQSAPSTGHHAGLHPESSPQTDTRTRLVSQTGGYPLGYDEGLEPEPPRSRGSIVPRGTAIQKGTPQSLIRVSDHRGQPIPQRTHRPRQQPRPQPQTEEYDDEEPETHAPRRHLIRQYKPRKHPLVYVGGILVLGLGIAILINIVGHFVQVASDDWHYGRPRTYQTDADVGHGGVSHFTVENLGGHILIIEIVLNDPSKHKLYGGPQLTGQDADLLPATISFQDVNHNGLPEMLLSVDNTEYIFVNSPDGFKPYQQGG
jgi:hypothetical protein